MISLISEYGKSAEKISKQPGQKLVFADVDVNY